MAQTTTNANPEDITPLKYRTARNVAGYSIYGIAGLVGFFSLIIAVLCLAIVRLDYTWFYIQLSFICGGLVNGGLLIAPDIADKLYEACKDDPDVTPTTKNGYDAALIMGGINASGAFCTLLLLVYS